MTQSKKQPPPRAQEILDRIARGQRLAQWREQFADEPAWIDWKDSADGTHQLILDPDKGKSWWDEPVRDPLSPEAIRMREILQKLRKTHQ